MVQSKMSGMMGTGGGAAGGMSGAAGGAGGGAGGMLSSELPLASDRTFAIPQC